jgi:uncharacterized membrane protein YdjX (TVP38/TMEM64 family)
VTTLSESLDGALTRRDLLPSLRPLAWGLLLFALAIVLARTYATPIVEALAGHGILGAVLFVASTALAVVLPLFSNLALVPIAALLWGPWVTAALLLVGWVAGAALAFGLGRYFRAPLLRLFPGAARYAQIDRLLHPGHTLLSLIALRMTFPVDILSCVLGLFSLRTTALTNALSTLAGGAPFALLFAFLPALPWAWQVALFAVCGLAFVAYAFLALRRAPPA